MEHDASYLEWTPMRVAGKGQGTIPKPIRDRLGIGSGSVVESLERDGSVEIGISPESCP